MYYLTLTDRQGEHLLFTAETFPTVAKLAYHFRQQHPDANIRVRCLAPWTITTASRSPTNNSRRPPELPETASAL